MKTDVSMLRSYLDNILNIHLSHEPNKEKLYKEASDTCIEKLRSSFKEMPKEFKFYYVVCVAQELYYVSMNHKIVFHSFESFDVFKEEAREKTWKEIAKALKKEDKDAFEVGLSKLKEVERDYVVKVLHFK